MTTRRHLTDLSGLADLDRVHEGTSAPDEATTDVWLDTSSSPALWKGWDPTADEGAGAWVAIGGTGGNGDGTGGGGSGEVEWVGFHVRGGMSLSSWTGTYVQWSTLQLDDDGIIDLATEDTEFEVVDTARHILMAHGVFESTARFMWRIEYQPPGGDWGTIELADSWSTSSDQSVAGIVTLRELESGGKLRVFVQTDGTNLAGSSFFQCYRIKSSGGGGGGVSLVFTDSLGTSTTGIDTAAKGAVYELHEARVIHGLLFSGEVTATDEYGVAMFLAPTSGVVGEVLAKQAGLTFSSAGPVDRWVPFESGVLVPAGSKLGIVCYQATGSPTDTFGLFGGGSDRLPRLWNSFVEDVRLASNDPTESETYSAQSTGYNLGIAFDWRPAE